MPRCCRRQRASREDQMNYVSQDETMSAARDFIRAQADAVGKVADHLDESFESVAALLHACTGKVFVTGSGTSGAIARRMAHLLSVCGTPSVFVHPMDALHGTLGAVTSGDVLIALSKGGRTEELTEFARRARSRGAITVAVTGAEESPLNSHSDLVARVASPDADPEGIVAMGSTLATAAWGDALAMEVMRRREYAWEDGHSTHPAGAAGHDASTLLASAHKRAKDRSRRLG